MSKRLWILIGVIIIIFIGVTIAQPSKKLPTKPNESGTTAASSAIVSDISSVPETILQKIGKGSAESSPQPLSEPALTSGRKPEVLFVGAEYCPYCATERWAMAVALSKFGTFKNLKLTHSSTTDVYPDTRTLSFYGASYSSQYINFTSVELYSDVTDDGYYTQLQTPSAAQQAVLNKYDSGQSIPFIDFGGKYDITGATYSPAVLQGKSWNQIASSLANPSNAVAEGVDGAANTITAAICKLTNNQPGTVCNSVVVGLENSL